MVYFAADDAYFQQHGIFLLRSTLHFNKDWFVHVHLFNPSQETFRMLRCLKRVSFSTETPDDTLFVKTVHEIRSHADKAKRICKTIRAHDRNRLCGALSHLLDHFPLLSALVPRHPLINYLKKTYYSCQRFVVLEQLVGMGAIKGNIVALDADSLFNKALPIDMPHKNCDIAIKHRQSAGGQQFLAGAILLPANGNRKLFLGNLADELKHEFAMLKLEWGLDQVSLNKVVPKFKWENLTPALGDLEFSADSIIWIAKGNSKHDTRYTSAQSSYVEDPNLSSEDL
jgi:hypothetical protein